MVSTAVSREREPVRGRRGRAGRLAVPRALRAVGPGELRQRPALCEVGDDSLVGGEPERVAAGGLRLVCVDSRIRPVPAWGGSRARGWAPKLGGTRIR